ncbi:MAG: hypothetical protein JW750_07565 [Anaerolineaceae bacterium]|nr:hypothetical protein [Anaerolineaceae bacterium]
MSDDPEGVQAEPVEEQPEVAESTEPVGDVIREATSDDAPAHAVDLMVDDQAEEEPWDSNIPDVDTGETPAPEFDWVEKLVTDADMESLWIETSELEEEINFTLFHASEAETLLSKLLEARRHILGGKKQFDEARAQVMAVKFKLERARESMVDSKTVAPFLFAYEFIILVVFSFLALFVLENMLKELSTPLGTIETRQLVFSMIWGCLGGVTGALHALWRHVSKVHDFSRRYWLWYIVNPMLGIALGGFIFLIFQAGFFSLTAGSEELVIETPYIIYLFAWVVGFKQNVIYSLVRRLIDVLYPRAYLQYDNPLKEPDDF